MSPRSHHLPPAPRRQRTATHSFVLVFACAFLLAPISAGAQSTYDLPIEEHVFDNGLRLLVLERESDSRVAAKIFTDMGAIHEVPGLLGEAHFQEHIMFKGTPTLGTTDWAAERPIRERMWEVEAELIEEKNRARNTIRQRGVMDDYAHAKTTPRMDELLEELAALERQAVAFRTGGATNRWYQAFGGTGLTATTEQEYMKFDIMLPVERVDLFLRLEADRMTNTVFREFEQERTRLKFLAVVVDHVRKILALAEFLFKLDITKDHGDSRQGQSRPATDEYAVKRNP